MDDLKERHLSILEGFVFLYPESWLVLLLAMKVYESAVHQLKRVTMVFLLPLQERGERQ